MTVIRYEEIGDDLVFAVSVPPYHQVVKYDSIVWERQDDVLVEMQEEDVKALKEQRKAAEARVLAREPLFPSDKGYN